MTIRYKTLSSQSAEVIKHFTDLNQSAFTIQEAYTLLNEASTDSVKKLMRDMVKRGLLLRLKDGVYWIIPYEQDANTYFPNGHLVAKYLVNKIEYYIGYYSALEIHGHPKRSLSTVINKERLAILSRQTKTVAQLTIVDKKATVGERGVRVELVLPYRVEGDESPK